MLFTALIIVSGCKQSSDVVSESWIQKRKYRSGFHLNLGTKRQKEEVAVADMKTADIQRLASTKDKHYPLQKSGQLIHPERAVARQEQFLTKPVIASQVRKRLVHRKVIMEEDEEEPEDGSEKMKKSERKAIIFFVIGALALALSVFSFIMTTGFALFVNQIFFFLAPFALGFALVALTIGFIYLADALKSKNGETIFTERFYESMGKLALVLGITSLVLAILTGLGMVALFLAGVAAAGSLGGIVGVFLSIYLLGLFTFVFSVISWPTITAVWFSFNKTNRGKAGFFFWLIPFLGLLVIAAMVIFL